MPGAGLKHGALGCMTLPLLKKKIKVRYKHAKSQERSQQRKREANNQAALAAESATSAMRVWQQIAIDDRLRAVYRLAAPSYEGHITTTLSRVPGKQSGCCLPYEVISRCILDQFAPEATRPIGLCIPRGKRRRHQ